MHKPTYKRLVIGLIQHFIAMLILITISGVILNATIAVSYMTGQSIYQVDFFGVDSEFEDSILFQEVLNDELCDIIRLAVIREQFETKGVFDSNKIIDITEYANRKGRRNGCPATVEYTLDNLLKWGEEGISYSQRSMSIYEFMEDYVEWTDFALDDNHQIYFAGFHDNTGMSEQPETEEDSETYYTELQKALEVCSEGQRGSMVISYMEANIPKYYYSTTKEEDGTIIISFNLLHCKYPMADGSIQLTECAPNWFVYMMLQENLVDTINSIAINYTQYRDWNTMYQDDSSNLKYCIQKKSSKEVQTITNLPAVMNNNEDEITETFTEYGKYFVFFKDREEYTGNTGLSERQVSDLLKNYGYAYPEDTRIWVGIDTQYSVKNDPFYKTCSGFRKIVPYTNQILATVIILLLIWIVIEIYLTVNAGVAYTDAGEKILYLNYFDHAWVELIILFIIITALLELCAIAYLVDIAYDNIYSLELAGMDRLYQHILFGIYGFLSSMFINIYWFSLVRRIKSGKFWKYSFFSWLFSKIEKTVTYMAIHGNVAVITFLLYNIFLLINITSMIAIFFLRYKMFLTLAIVIFLIIFNTIVGMRLFKNIVEKRDIVEGIEHIRNGEVDYKLNLESLHGSNKEMADAVNNIGEGMRKAVMTSMKDERLKTDLITNVSHDLKTPLTSIINYVDLLKRLRIEEEPAKTYIEVLDEKSQRLKQLTEDLLESSKLSSGNIEFHKECINLAELIDQSIGEFTEKMEERGLKLVFDRGNVPTYVYADSQRMWRVMENLLNNIYKYALKNTRVYIDLSLKPKEGQNFIEMSIKNISERQLNIKADDLTERFIRGDSSRTTEGSGLGLYIAKNLVEAQGGTFEIRLDGDLFKALITFPEYVPPETHSEDASNDTMEDKQTLEDIQPPQQEEMPSSN